MDDDGYFSLGSIPPSPTLYTFSTFRSYSVVAPFAASISTTYTGSVRYNTFTTGDTNINTVSSYIRSQLGGSFSGSWMIIADWYNVPQNGSFTVSVCTPTLITSHSNCISAFCFSQTRALPTDSKELLSLMGPLHMLFLYITAHIWSGVGMP